MIGSSYSQVFTLRFPGWDYQGEEKEWVHYRGVRAWTAVGWLIFIAVFNLVIHDGITISMTRVHFSHYSVNKAWFWISELGSRTFRWTWVSASLRNCLLPCSNQFVFSHYTELHYPMLLLNNRQMFSDSEKGSSEKGSRVMLKPKHSKWLQKWCYSQRAGLGHLLTYLIMHISEVQKLPFKDTENKRNTTLRADV